MATILLLAMTVVLFASIFAWVTTFPPPPPQNNNQFQASLRYTANQTYINGIQILHLAGPSVPGTGSVFLASSTQPTAPEFANPYSISSGLGGGKSWNLGQVWNLTFPLTEMPRAGGNITIYVVSSYQLLFSVILPGTTTAPPPTITSTSVSPATPTIGTIYTVYATISGNFASNSVYVNLAAVPGGPSTPQEMSLNSQGFWTYTVPSGATANGTFYGFVNASNSAGGQSTGIVVITIYPSATSTNGPLSVGVILIPSPPNALSPETVQAVVTYTGTAQNAGLNVSFTAITVPYQAGQKWTGWAPSGLTISGPSSVTAVSKTSWTIPATSVATSFVVYANATISGVGSASGLMSFTTSTLALAGSPALIGSTVTATGGCLRPRDGSGALVRRNRSHSHGGRVVYPRWIHDYHDRRWGLRLHFCHSARITVGRVNGFRQRCVDGANGNVRLVYGNCMDHVLDGRAFGQQRDRDRDEFRRDLGGHFDL